MPKVVNLSECAVQRGEPDPGLGRLVLGGSRGEAVHGRAEPVTDLGQRRGRGDRQAQLLMDVPDQTSRVLQPRRFTLQCIRSMQSTSKSTFTEGWSGPAGAPWSPSWAAFTSQGVVDTQSGTGRLQYSDQTGACARASLTGVSPVTDSDLVFSYQWSSSAARAYFNVYLRGSGGW